LERPDPTATSRWNRPLSRRDLLRLGAVIAAGGVVGTSLAACASNSGTQGPSAASRAITVLVGGGDPSSEPGLKQGFDDFKAHNPGVEWDIRALPGGGPEWDRLARAAIASGEPVDLIAIDGLFIRAWTRDGLLADLDADPKMTDILARVPAKFHLAGLGKSATRAVPLAMTRGLHTTGLYYNKAILDKAGLEPPKKITDFKAMVTPLAALGAAPLVHCSGDSFFNPLLVMWVLPMIAERKGDPLAFVESTIRGDVGYDSPEWIEGFQTIADLKTSGTLLAGSGATDYATMQQLVLQGKAAMTYNGTWLLPQLLAGKPTGPFDLHAAPLPVVDGAARSRPILAYAGFALPAKAAGNRDDVYRFLEYASRPDVDKAVTKGSQFYSPISGSNEEIDNPVAREFLPMLDDAITSLNWLWEPEIDVEIGNQVQALVKGDTDATSAGKAIEAVADGLRSSGRSYYS
jgi:arabinogalactan oligomer/maltooligosaccharide transport system substrate-binding protein